MDTRDMVPIIRMKMHNKQRILEAFLKVEGSFPFKGYMESKLLKYMSICSLLLEEAPPRAKVLDIGCGPCDLTAILSTLGYDLTGIDDLRDPWHLLGDNRKRIMDFANEMGIKLIVKPMERAGIKEKSFDAALLIDILERHPNPRILLNCAVSALKPGGILLIETSNAVALAKRVLVAMGKSNYPNVYFAYFNVGEYRSHVREYAVHELKEILKLTGLKEVRVKLTNHDVCGLLCESSGLKRLVVKLYLFISSLWPKFRSTILIYGRKPEDWHPVSELDAIKHLGKLSPYS